MYPFGAAVEPFMTPTVRAVYPDATLEEARQRLEEWRISCLAVVEETGDEMEMRGVISLGDLLRAGTMSSRPDRSARLVLPEATVESMMTRDIVRVDVSDSVATAARVMVDNHIHRVFVEEAGAVVGVFSTRDVMKVLASNGVVSTIAEYMSSPVHALHVDATIADGIDMLERHDISGVIVIERGWPCGVFTPHEVLRSRHLPVDTTIGDATNPAILVLPQRTPVHRAAANAGSVDVRRIIVSDEQRMVGVMSGLDFCRVVVDHS